MVSVRRGDVFWTRFEPVEGSELAGLRPAVVVQNDTGNRFSATTIVVGITTRFAHKGYPMVARLPEGVLPKSSAVNCAQIRTVDKARFQGERLAHLDAPTMHTVDDALRASLGLER
jgi:mRNA interferase MazF